MTPKPTSSQECRALVNELEQFVSQVANPAGPIFSAAHELYDEAQALLGAPRKLAVRIEQLEEALDEIANGELVEILELAVNARQIARRA